MSGKTVERIMFGTGTASALFVAGTAGQSQNGSGSIVPQALTDAFNSVPWWAWLGLAALNGYFFVKSF